ncbi:SPOR domain-containing protein [Polaribacter uvawellassae]|uniref:HU domain-containing protein n=1 Tax=Polaribacter uvawellassae TaxID=3133495 RepID=UPI0032198235
MTLTSYINDLLYRYDCVIIPDFGGFVTNAISAKVNHFSHTFYPPTKQVTFNAHLKNNDGLLANHIASSENISFEKASEKISEVVKAWNAQLKTEAVVIGKVGSLSLNKENQLIFEPNSESNYLIETFGMNTLSSPAVKRLEYQQQATKLTPVVAKKSSSRFIKYAAAAAIFLTVGAIGWNGYQNNQLKEQYAKQQQDLEKKIQSATFVIGDPLPTIQLNVAKETPKNFHIIAGAFEFPENAEKKLRQLKAKGFNAEIIGKNKWGLTQVTYSSFETRAEAYKNLEKIRDTYSEDAWMFIKKLQ